MGMGWTTNEEDVKVISKETVEDRNPKLYIKRAKALTKMGMKKEAGEEYDKAIEYSEGKLSCYFSKFFFCLDNQMFGTAIGVLFTIFWVIIWKKLRVLWIGLLAWGISFVSLEYFMRFYAYQYYSYFTSIMGFIGISIVVVAICKMFEVNCLKYIFCVAKIFVAIIISSFMGDGLYVIILLGAILYGFIYVILLVQDIRKVLKEKRMGFLKDKENKKKDAKYARNKMVKRFGIGIGAAGVVCLIVILGLQCFHKDSDSLQVARKIEQDSREFHESYQDYDELQQTEDIEAADGSYLVAYPDGDESKTPVKYIEDSGSSWEKETDLVAEQKAALMEYLGCGEDNLWQANTAGDYMQEDTFKVTFWYSYDYSDSMETALEILFLEDGTAAWIEDIYDETYFMRAGFALHTIERNAFKETQNSSGTLNTRTFSETDQKAMIAEYMGCDETELSYYRVNDAGRKDFLFDDNSDGTIQGGNLFLLDDGTVAMYYEGVPPCRVIGNKNGLSEFSLAEQQSMVEEYFGCRVGHIKYSYSTDNVDGDIRPLFQHIDGDSVESDLYLADDFTVRKLVDYQERTSETVDRNYFHINSMTNYSDTYGD